VTIGSKTATVSANVRTNYKIDVRFFGRTLSASDKALFTNAAARLRALIVGALPPSLPRTLTWQRVASATGVAPLTETIDGVVIFRVYRLGRWKGKNPCAERTVLRPPRTGDSTITAPRSGHEVRFGGLRLSHRYREFAGSDHARDDARNRLRQLLGFGAQRICSQRQHSGHLIDCRVHWGRRHRGLSVARGDRDMSIRRQSKALREDRNPNSHWRESTFFALESQKLPKPITCIISCVITSANSR